MIFSPFCTLIWATLCGLKFDFQHINYCIVACNTRSSTLRMADFQHIGGLLIRPSCRSFIVEFILLCCLKCQENVNVQHCETVYLDFLFSTAILKYVRLFVDNRRVLNVTCWESTILSKNYLFLSSELVRWDKLCRGASCTGRYFSASSRNKILETKRIEYLFDKRENP